MLRTASFILPLLLALAPLGCKKTESSNEPAPNDASAHDCHACEGKACEGKCEAGHCEKGGCAHDDFEGREVVDNWKAQVGDVTTCPMSGNKFEVEEDSLRYEYQGYTFVFCCQPCLDKAKADPSMLDKLVEQAGGPASDPDKSAGVAVEET